MRSTPPVIKAEIFRKYLEGYSIPEISDLCNVSVGNAHSTITEESDKDNDFFQIREITKIFRKNNLKISDVIYAIRLHNKVRKLGLDTSFFENFLDTTDTESFKLNIEHPKFLEEIKSVLHFEKISKIKLHGLPIYIIKTNQEYKDLKNTNNKLLEENNELLLINKKLKEENAKLYFQNNIEKYQVEEFLQERQSFLSYQKNIDIHKRFPKWIMNEVLFEEASKKLRTKIDPEVLYKKMRWIYNLPHEYTSIIKKIMAIDPYRSK